MKMKNYMVMITKTKRIRKISMLMKHCAILTAAVICICLTAGLCLQSGSAFATGDAQEAEALALQPQNGIPLVIVRVNETEGTSIEEMNSSFQHSVRCESATVEIRIPEGYEGGYPASDGGEAVTAPEGEIALKYVRGRGNSTWQNSKKKPYKLEMIEAHDLFGMGESTDWALLANSFDASLIRNRITNWLGEQMGLEFTPQQIPVDLVMVGSESGIHQYGSYCLCETIKVEESRINIGKLKKKETENISGGYVLATYGDQGKEIAESTRFTTNYGVEFMNDSPEYDDTEGALSEAQLAQRSYIRGYVQELENLIMVPDEIDAARHQEIADRMDLTSAADYWLLQEISYNTDAFATTSTYLYKKRDGKLYWGPLWDFDYAWGNATGDELIVSFNNTSMLWIDQLRDKDPLFVSLLQDRWQLLNVKLQELTADGGIIDSYSAEVSESQQADYAIWSEAAQAGDYYNGAADYPETIRQLKTWIDTRRAWAEENKESIGECFFTVSYEANGQIIATERVRYGNKAVMDPDAPAPEGYVFECWKKGNKSLNKVVIKEDTVFTAQYVNSADATAPSELVIDIPPEMTTVDVSSGFFPAADPSAGISGSLNDFAIVEPYGQVTNPRITWTSSDEKVAAIDPVSKRIVLKAGGDVTITGRLYNGVSASFVLHVTGPEPEPEPAVRTVMLYICASDLESRSGMATYNLKQILSANFSRDNNVRFIVMTGGTTKWRTENKYLCDPYGIGIETDTHYDWETDSFIEGSVISRNYNQIWEAKGADAVDENGDPDENAGKLWLLKGKGLTGDDVRSEDELMSDPNTLKAFINYCVTNYPAQKYDLILWDHGGGPTGGYGYDLHNKAAGEKTMQLDQIMDAVSDNLVTDSNGDGVRDGSFDFIDFDACLMSTVELALTLGDWMDYYIASPETEPGLGQNYTPWLNALGNDPDHDTYELGKIIVDSYIDLYENGDENGMGIGDRATLSVVNIQKFMSSGFIGAMQTLCGELHHQAAAKGGNEYLFYDELGSAAGSIEYEMEGCYDLGNLAGQLAVTKKEASEDLAPDENPYIDPAKKISAILESKDIIYGRGTDNIRAAAQFFMDKSGKLRYDDQLTSGIYTFFPSVKNPAGAVEYCDDMAAAIGCLPEEAAEDGRRDLLLQLRQVAADYGLILETGRAVSDLSARGSEQIDYQAVRDNYWKKRKNKKGNSLWKIIIQPLLEVRGGAAAETDENVSWMDAVIRQQADEVLTSKETTAYTVSQKGDSKDLRIVFSGTNKRIVSGASLEVYADLLSAEAFIDANPNLDETDREVLLKSPLGGYEAEECVDDLEFSDTSSPQRMLDDYLSWYNSGTSSWNFKSVEDKWYAVRDENGGYHAAKVDFDEESITVPVQYKDAEFDVTMDADLIFRRSGSEYRLSKLRLWADSNWRTIQAAELKEPLKDVMTVNEVQLVEGFPIMLPLSGSVFTITPDNTDSIILDYVPLSQISDIDTAGENRGLHRSYVVRDIYNNKIDISEQASHPAGELISIEQAEVSPVFCNGSVQEPVVTYNGETLTAGTDYTLYKLSDVKEFVDPGKYYITLHGKGRFCGIYQTTFTIMMTKEQAEKAVAEALEAAEAAEEAVWEAQDAVLAAIESGSSEDIAEAYSRLVAAQRALTEAQETLAEAKESLSRAEQALLNDKTEQLQQQIDDKDEQINDLSGRVKDMDEQINDLDGQIKDKDKQISDLNDRIKSTDDKINDLSDRVKEKDGEISDLNSLIKNMDEQIRTLNDQLADLNDQLSEITVIDITGYAVTMKSSYPYTGKAIKPAVRISGLNESCYTVSYSNNKKIGTAKVIIKAKGDRYKGTITKTFSIVKAANTLKIKGKKAPVKYSRLKKKSQTLKISRVIKFTNKGQGAKSYKLVSAKKGKKNFINKFRIDPKTGKVTVKKGLKKGTYKLRLKVKAAGNANYKASGWKTVTITIQVKK